MLTKMKNGDNPAPSPSLISNEGQTIIGRAVSIEGSIRGKENLVIEGTLVGDGQVIVNGRFNGIIESLGSVTVAPRGRAEAAFHAAAVVVSGKVLGNISADERIELEATADVTGDLSAPRVLIREGAKITGRITMRGSDGRRYLTKSS